VSTTDSNPKVVPSSKDVFFAFTSPKSLKKDINRLLELAGFSYLDPGKRTLLKINGNVDRFYPGSNTSCWFLDAFLECLVDRGFNDVAAMEGDLPLFTVEQMLNRTGMDHVLEKHGIRCINLQNEPTNEEELPLILYGAQIINLPTPHTHGFAIISCATKNLWGLLPVHRFRYHPVLTEKMLDLYRAFKVFSVVDGTVCMKGDSTRTGTPLRTDFLMAGQDMLTVDSVAAKIMGFDLSEIPLLAKAVELRMVPENICVRGDRTWRELPLHDCRFRRGPARRVTMWLEGVSGNRWLQKKTRDILHSRIVVRHYNRVVGMYVDIRYQRKKKLLTHGPWMEYAQREQGGPSLLPDP
jgi:uncharacterized protein (DUF362 family)